MLHRLSANRSSFKAIDFRPGLNILLTERTTASDDAAEQLLSRNGAGKSSVIDIIHFLLGGQHEGALKTAALADWTFRLELDLGSERGEVERNITSRKTVERGAQFEVLLGFASTISNTDWCKELGHIWFGLPEEIETGGATFRQLISYFARRKRDGGFEDPVRSVHRQSAMSIETTLAELLGLDSELVRKLHQTKAMLKKYRAAQTALADMESVTPKGQRRVDLEAQLAAQLAAAKLSRDRLEERIASFNVLPAFRDLERELADLNQSFRDLSDRDVIDQEVITINERALASEEQAASTTDLLRLFEEAKVVFPERVIGRYDEVERFHTQLVEHRQVHLRSELTAAQRRIAERQPAREALEGRRRVIIASLRSRGPADELLRLRDELASSDADVKGLQIRLDEARGLEERVEQIKLALDDAGQALKQDWRERYQIVETASRTFSEISERLYKQPGSLAISAGENGLQVIPKTPSDQSAGVMSMEIFCFDLTLATLARRRGHGPGFLIHDSHLFEPVDGRQFARALEIADEFSRESGVQYVALLNSDELARAQQESGHDFSRFVLDTKLADTPDGGLFGIRFD